MNSNYGIFVNPMKEHGKISKFGWTKIDFTIFANTWGIYLEEVTIDIGDIQCYAFSLIIEVVPTTFFPIGLNSVTEYPTIR